MVGSGPDNGQSRMKDEGGEREGDTWLPDGYSQILRMYVFGPSGLKDYGFAMLRCKI